MCIYIYIYIYTCIFMYTYMRGGGHRVQEHQCTRRTAGSPSHAGRYNDIRNSTVRYDNTVRYVRYGTYLNIRMYIYLCICIFMYTCEAAGIVFKNTKDHIVFTSTCPPPFLGSAPPDFGCEYGTVRRGTGIHSCSDMYVCMYGTYGVYV